MKKLLIPALLLIGIIAAYWFSIGNPFHLLPRKPEPAIGQKVDTNAPIKTASPTSFIPAPAVVQDKNGFPLMQGSRGDYVKKMQTALNDRYGSELTVDGIFGTKTAKALSAHGFDPSLISYQHFNEITGK